MLQAIRDAPGQAWRMRSVFALVLVPTVGLLVLVAVAAATTDVPVDRFLSDPLETLEANPLLGLVSNLGIALWSAAAGACLLAALVLRRGRASREAVQFLFWSGAFTAVLGLDDLYQLHETVVPSLLGRGQTLVLLGYVAMAAAYVWRFRRALAAAEHVLLVAAGGFFALSLGVDLLFVVDVVLPWDLLPDEEDALFEAVEHLVEDGAKLIGIAFWLAFFLRTAAGALAPRGDSPASTPSA